MKSNVEPSRSRAVAAAVRGGAKEAPAPLAPLLAGARARGVADGLELIGAAAALLDEQGEVLHVNDRALGLMGQTLFVSGERLRARDDAADAALTQAIGSTLRQGVASRVAVGEGSGEGALGIRIVPISNEDGKDAFQLLRAVAIIEPCRETFASTASQALN
jgi:hypothetical protein